MIKFLVNYGFFESRLFPICKYCGKNNSRSHIIKECKEKFFVDVRKEYGEKIRAFLGRNDKEFDLEKGIMDIYFKPKDKDVKLGLLILKEYITKIYVERPKNEGDDGDDAGKNK